MSAPTNSELNILKQFRKECENLNLEDEGVSDLKMLRWLRARDMDIPKAKTMLEKSIEWRKKENLAQIREWKIPEIYRDDYTYEIVGRDSQGRPVAIIPFGKWDIRKAITNEDKDIWFRQVDKFLSDIYEKMEQTSLEFGHEVTQFIVIVDVAGFSPKQLASVASVNTIIEAVRRFDLNYPEILYSFIIVNAHRLFKMFFSLIKPTMSARTVSKMEIYSNGDKWKECLLSKIPKDQLPINYGGSYAERRKSLFGMGLEVLNIEDPVSVIEFEVAAGEKLELEYSVYNPNTTIKWAFKTKNYDIGFYVTFERKEKLFEKDRCDSHIHEETGSILCEKVGEYFLVFDNSYSKLRGKFISYNVEVFDPEDEKL